MTITDEQIRDVVAYLQSKTYDTAFFKGFHLHDEFPEIHSLSAEESRFYKEKWSELRASQALMLIVSELAEALEEIRKGITVTKTYYVLTHSSSKSRDTVSAEAGDAYKILESEYSTAKERESAYKVLVKYGLAKPEGVPTELADVLIRVLNFAGSRGIDLADALLLKMTYNDAREYKHGGKAF